MICMQALESMGKSCPALCFCLAVVEAVHYSAACVACRCRGLLWPCATDDASEDSQLSSICCLPNAAATATSTAADRQCFVSSSTAAGRILQQPLGYSISPLPSATLVWPLKQQPVLLRATSTTSSTTQLASLTVPLQHNKQSPFALFAAQPSTDAWLRLFSSSVFLKRLWGDEVAGAVCNNSILLQTSPVGCFTQHAAAVAFREVAFQAAGAS